MTFSRQTNTFGVRTSRSWYIIYPTLLLPLSSRLHPLKFHIFSKILCWISKLGKINGGGNWEIDARGAVSDGQDLREDPPSRLVVWLRVRETWFAIGCESGDLSLVWQRETCPQGPRRWKAYESYLLSIYIKYIYIYGLIEYLVTTRFPDPIGDDMMRKSMFRNQIGVGYWAVNRFI